MNYSRRQFLKHAAAGAATVLISSCDSAIRSEHKARTNFLFILVDDLGWKDLSCYGSRFYETPNIDRLASESMRFTDAYAACPVCSPTRASIMTGKYPARMDTTDWFGAPQPGTVQKHWTRNKPLLPAHYIEKMALEEVTIAETFNLAGYRTFFAGKWHLGPEGYWPKAQGFDVNKGGWKSGSPSGKGKYFVPYGNPRLKDGPEEEHLPDRLAKETVKFIEKNRNKPFLAYLSFYSVHTPLISRKDLEHKYLEKKKTINITGPIWAKEGDRKFRQVQEHAVYAGMVEAMDEAVGKVIAKIKSLGLDDNTAVIFFSDNGGLSTAEGSPTSNLPLRAGKGWLYEGGIREPMIVKWPGVTKPASICNEPLISTDFYPTMLEMASLEQKPQQHIDGVSFVPLLKGKKMTRGPIYWHYPHYGNQGSSPGTAIRDGNFKLIEWFEDNRLELYNLKEDIGETTNLIDKQSDIAARLHHKLKLWQKQVNAKMPTLNTNSDGWYDLFNGKDMSGWKASEKEGCFTVENGAIKVRNERSHLFYVGDVENADFKNFEFSAKVKTTPRSNSGIYFHTQYQQSGWPEKGYECQVNITHSDKKKSGGLYGIQDTFEQHARDNQWYTQEIIVKDKHIITKINGKVISDYTEGDPVPGRETRRLSSGTFALQAHDPKSITYYKDIKVKPLE